MSEKIFVGNTEKKTVGKGEDAWAYFALGFSEEHLALLAQHLNSKGWVNVDLKKGSSGKYYMEIFKPKQQEPKVESTETVIDPDDLPF